MVSRVGRRSSQIVRIKYYYPFNYRFGGFGHIPERILSSPCRSTKYDEESGWTSLARSETTPRYSKRSPMVLISASESSSKNTLVYIFRNPAEREKGVGRWRREYPVNHSAKTEGSIMFHTHTHTHKHSLALAYTPRPCHRGGSLSTSPTACTR